VAASHLSHSRVVGRLPVRCLAARASTFSLFAPQCYNIQPSEFGEEKRERVRRRKRDALVNFMLRIVQ